MKNIILHKILLIWKYGVNKLTPGSVTIYSRQRQFSRYLYIHIFAFDPNLYINIRELVKLGRFGRYRYFDSWTLDDTPPPAIAPSRAAKYFYFKCKWHTHKRTHKTARYDYFLSSYWQVIKTSENSSLWLLSELIFGGHKDLRKYLVMTSLWTHIGKVIKTSENNSLWLLYDLIFATHKVLKIKTSLW